MIVYPNPTTAIINIVNGNEDLKNIQIYDITGKKFKQFTPQTQINLTDISKSIYIIKMIFYGVILLN